MKKSILFILLFLLTLASYGQGVFEKSLDKFNVQTINVSGYTFSVGDTLTFATGSLPDGGFASTQLSPGIFLLAGEIPPHLDVGYTNYNFIIEKIRYAEDGLNSSVMLVFYLDLRKKTPVWVNAELAILKKEIK